MGRTYYNHKCEQCNKSYDSLKRESRFCSRQCMSTWQKENGIKPPAKTINHEELEPLFIKEVEAKYPFMKYVSGFTNRESSFNYRCIHCNEVQTVTCQIVRKSWTKKTKCKNCTSLESERIRALKQKQKEKDRIDRERKTQELKAVKALLIEQHKMIQDIDRYSKTHICRQCGCEFHAYKKRPLYCSAECINRQRNANKDKKRQALMQRNGYVDNSITLDKLIKRDKNVCHICKGKCDKKDHKKDNQGTFIAGSNYPSIDHVIPISKKGTHTWDNVKLAHMYCNTIKSDKI